MAAAAKMTAATITVRTTATTKITIAAATTQQRQTAVAVRSVL
jgi:hypothetical protein